MILCGAASGIWGGIRRGDALSIKPKTNNSGSCGTVIPAARLTPGTSEVEERLLTMHFILYFAPKIILFEIL